MQSYILSLRTVNDKPILNYNLGLCIVNEDNQEVQIKLSDRIVSLKKYDYLNKDKIFDDGKQFFILVNKQLSKKYAFDLLMKYAMNKIDSRIEHLKALKMNYQKQLTTAA